MVVLKNDLIGDTILTARECKPSQSFDAITMRGTKQLMTVDQADRVMKDWEKFVEESLSAERPRKSR